MTIYINEFKFFFGCILSIKILWCLFFLGGGEGASSHFFLFDCNRKLLFFFPSSIGFVVVSLHNLTTTLTLSKRITIYKTIICVLDFPWIITTFIKEKLCKCFVLLMGVIVTQQNGVSYQNKWLSKTMCDTNKNVTKMSVITKEGVLCVCVIVFSRLRWKQMICCWVNESLKNGANTGVELEAL